MLNHRHCTLTLTTASHKVVEINNFSHVMAKSTAGRGIRNVCHSTATVMANSTAIGRHG
jgi:hypothetical protein